MQTKRKNQNDFSATATSLISYCPLCDTSFSPKQAAVIGQGGDVQLLHTICSRCGSSIVLLLLTSEAGISSVGLITDLTEGEVGHFACSAAVSTDDIIELHEYLSLKNALPV